MKKFVFLLLSCLLRTGCSQTDKNSSTTNRNSKVSQIATPSVTPSTEEIPSNSRSNNKSSVNQSTDKPASVTVFSVNDIHGSLEKYNDPDYGNKELGIARLSYAIKQDSDYDPNTSIIISSGDSWQGGYLAHEERTLTDKLLGERGVVSRAIGNHEFDFGLKTREELSKVAPYPYLGLNIVDSKGEIPSFLKKSAIIEKGGVRYGIRGVIDSGIESTIKAGNRGQYTFSDSRNLISAEADYLLSQGCDLVLLSAHADCKSRYVQAIGNTFDSSKISGIFGGHSHRFQNETVGKLPYVQGSSNSRGYCKRTFSLSTKKATSRRYVEAKDCYNVADSLLEKDILDELDDANKKHPTHNLATFSDTFSKGGELNRFVPQVRINRAKKQNLGEEKTKRKLVGIHNLGGIRSSIPKGTRTEKELFKFSPFDNLVLVSKSVKGSEIRNSIGSDTAYGVTGNYCYYVEGKSSISSNDLYDVITIDFVATGSYWRGTEPFINLNQDGSELVIRDRYKNYFRSLGDNPTISSADYE